MVDFPDFLSNLALEDSFVNNAMYESKQEKGDKYRERVTISKIKI